MAASTAAASPAPAETPASETPRSSSGGGEVESVGFDAQCVQLAPFCPDWRFVCDLLEERSLPYAEHYRFGMEVAKLWQVRPGRLQRRQREEAEALGKPKLLFHGTSPQNIDGILREGFRLSERRCMFGGGVYFAECPLKSVQFSEKAAPKWKQGSPWRSAVACLSGAAVGSAATRMLVCEVFLGKSLTVWRPKQVGLSDLERGWLPKAFGAENYNSVYVPGGSFFAVNVPEYVVYRPYQAIPKYVIEFRCRKPEDFD